MQYVVGFNAFRRDVERDVGRKAPGVVGSSVRPGE
jgi:hypothetical protein